MDQKRLFAAIALSIGILLLFDVYKRMMAPPEAPAPKIKKTIADGRHRRDQVVE